MEPDPIHQKMEQLQFLQVGTNGGQWSKRIEDNGKRNCQDGPWDMGKERRVIDREEVDGSKN